MSIFTSNRVLPIMTDVTQLLTATTNMRTVVSGLFRPWGRPFKVTAKGTSTERITVQWGQLLPFALMIAGTVAGLVGNLSQFSALRGTQGYAVNVFWSIYNVLFLAVAVAVCVELPRRRGEERFATDERAAIRWADGGETPCRLRDISMGGAHLDGIHFAPKAAPAGTLLLDGGAIEAPFAPVRAIGGNRLAVRFSLSAPARRALIRKLFSGANRNKVDEIVLPRVVLAIARKLLG